MRISRDLRSSCTGTLQSARGGIRVTLAATAAGRAGCELTTVMTTRRGIQPWIDKYLSNPTMRLLLRAGAAPKAFALIETIGRRTGRRRLTPVGNGLDGRTFWLISEHGERSSYVKNLMAEPRVRVKVGRRWLSGTATLLPDDDARARRARLDGSNGLAGRINGVMFSSAATDPLTIRVDLDP